MKINWKDIGSMQKVIIVESPSKSKTIESYVGKDYKVIASIGHIRDLATSGKDGLGIDIENNFTPSYRIIKGKEKLVESIKKTCKGKEVYLATDPDREGEAISYHLATVLNLNPSLVNRIEFHEVTKPAVLEAINNPRSIDMNLVNSQETRRMLDRIIGFKVSKLLQSRIKSQSAGRVQSVALKLIVDLEDEIAAFKPEAYYELVAHFKDFDLDYAIESPIKDKKQIEAVYNSLGNDFVVKDITSKSVKRESKPPYTTSTMQQDASTKLGFQSSRTMRVAQALYEGKEINGEHMGLITYMRTDSTHLSNVFVSEAYAYITSNYGEDYKGFRKEKKQMLSQDAHEAIRPTSIYRTPEMMKEYLTQDEYRLYSLVYKRTLASLMSASRFKQTKVLFDNNNNIFQINGRILEFDGYTKAYGLEEDDLNVILPDFKIGDIYHSDSNEIIEKYTKPKPRYTEASLIKDMEKLGIGRPSTYAQTMTTLKERKYIEVVKKALIPTEQGILTTKTLDKYFSSIFNVEYTANMELDLDKIAKGMWNELDEMNKFYNSFEPVFLDAKASMDKIYPKPTGEMCPVCGNELVIRKGKYGEFIACSTYPKCKYVKPQDNGDNNLPVNEVITINNTKLGTVKFVKKLAKRGANAGNYFYASHSPKLIYNDTPTNNECPNCGGIMLLDKDGNLYCSNKCKTNTIEDKKIKCPTCNKGYLIKRVAARGKNKGSYFYGCQNFPKCRAIYTLTDELCPACGSEMVKSQDILVCTNPLCTTHKQAK